MLIACMSSRVRAAENKRAIVKGGGVPLVSDCMHRHMQTAAVIEPACWMLADLAADRESLTACSRLVLPVCCVVLLSSLEIPCMSSVSSRLARYCVFCSGDGGRAASDGLRRDGAAGHVAAPPPGLGAGRRAGWRCAGVPRR